MSYLQATLYVENTGKSRKRVFTKSMPHMRGEIHDNRLIVTVPSFYCRDEIIRSLSFLFDNVTKSGYRIRGYSKNGRSPKFEFKSTVNQAYSREVDMREVLGATNRSFSPLASPYLLRYVIGNYRKDKAHVWFQNLLNIADDKGIKLQQDFAKAWQLGKMSGSFYGEYGRMGLANLRTLAPAGVLSNGTQIDYLEAFPPIEFK